MPESDNQENRNGDSVSEGGSRASEPQNKVQNSQDYPEPPVSWRPGVHSENNPTPHEQPPKTTSRSIIAIGNTVTSLSNEEAAVFASGRTFITASQVAAIVSLFFGGILLSSVAIVLAVIGARKLSSIASSHAENVELRSAVNRSSALAIGMTVLALIVNVVTIILFYPIIVDAMNSGDLSTLFTGGQSAAPSPSNPAPGYDLFG